MISSMTAFGTGEYQNDHGSYRCEIKTLNSRFLDQNIRLPRKLVALEHEVIDQVMLLFFDLIVFSSERDDLHIDLLAGHPRHLVGKQSSAIDY